MINPLFAVIGLWIVAMFITFLAACAIAAVISDKTDDFIYFFGIALALVVVILELLLCSTYVEFKNNPEDYGYTRIEQEVMEVSDNESNH